MQENFSRVFITGDTHGNVDWHKLNFVFIKYIFSRVFFYLIKYPNRTLAAIKGKKYKLLKQGR